MQALCSKPGGFIGDVLASWTWQLRSGLILGILDNDPTDYEAGPFRIKPPSAMRRPIGSGFARCSGDQNWLDPLF